MMTKLILILDNYDRHSEQQKYKMAYMYNHLLKFHKMSEISNGETCNNSTQCLDKMARWSILIVFWSHDIFNMAAL